MSDAENASDLHSGDATVYLAGQPRNEKGEFVAKDAVYKDPEWLRQKYYNEGMDTPQMAEVAGCSKPTILRWMDNYGMERRRQFQRSPPPRLEMNRWGHEFFRSSCRGVRNKVYHHQLVAIAHETVTPQEAFGNSGIVVHHENEIPWDNRPDNLQRVSRAEHVWIHRGLYGRDQAEQEETT